MGPGRLTGMNVAPNSPIRGQNEHRFNGARSIDRDERGGSMGVVLVNLEASMGPGRLTGMNDRWLSVRDGQRPRASMGPGRLTGMNGDVPLHDTLASMELQWGPVD